jgi:nitroimidazol reductase NimA-like FMN-containing flavoprotein (pyridoxamine 5'-phosphate oxidase superfamily)
VTHAVPSQTELDGALGPGPMTKIRRFAERAGYDRQTVFSILDEGLVCHLGICADGVATVVPTAYARVGDALYLHGAPANATLAGAVKSPLVCVCVTLVDGLVLARSAFHHSVNYRSVVLYGEATEVTDGEEKRRAMTELVEHMVPGRSSDARPPTEAELRATKVVRVDIREASAKVRTGGPKEEPGDLALSTIWAGELPLRVTPQTPIAEHQGALLPGYLSPYERGRAGAGEQAQRGRGQ